jgi:hypothetical protein
MARLNNVKDRVHVRSWCDEAILKNTSIGRCLIISDCEAALLNVCQRLSVAGYGRR